MREVITRDGGVVEKSLDVAVAQGRISEGEKGAAGGRKCQTKPYEVVTHLRLGSRLMPPVDTDYGIREFAVVDKSGNLVRLG
jgi:hypothetical protein